jgi:hypothetical protein
MDPTGLLGEPQVRASHRQGPVVTAATGLETAGNVSANLEQQLPERGRKVDSATVRTDRTDRSHFSTLPSARRIAVLLSVEISETEHDYPNEVF